MELAVLLGDKISSRTSQDGVSPYTFSGGAGGMGCPSLAESGTMQVCVESCLQPGVVFCVKLLNANHFFLYICMTCSFVCTHMCTSRLK
jgi:hypothetical protein